MPFYKTHKFNLFILILLAFFAYINIYNNGFLSDDIDGIVKNLIIRDVGYNLRSGIIQNVILSLNYAVGGLNPPIYHLTSVIFHTLNVILVYILVNLLPNTLFTKFSSKKSLAFFTALIFAVHAIHTEAVTWISGRGYVFYSFFVLISLVSFIYFFNHPKLPKKIKIPLFGLSLVSFFFALQTSERAAILPGLLIAYLLIFNKIKALLVKRTFFLLTPYFIMPLFYLTVFLDRLAVRTEKIAPLFDAEPTIRNPFIQITVALSTYIKLLFNPTNLTLYHQFVITRMELIQDVIITLLFFAPAVIFFRKSKILLFALAFFFIAISLNLLPLKISWLAAERYIYLASVGFCLFLTYAIYKLGELLKSPPLPIILLSIFAGLNIFLTLNRNLDWQNQDTFWPATVKTSPLIPAAHNNMGDFYARHKNFDKAIEEFTLANDLRGGKYPEAIFNTGLSYLGKNDASTAAKFFQKTLEMTPNILEAYIQLASIYISQKNYDKAEILINKVLELNPNYSPAYNALGVVTFVRGDWEKAKTFLLKAISLDPENLLPRANLDRLK